MAGPTISRFPLLEVRAEFYADMSVDLPFLTSMGDGFATNYGTTSVNNRLRGTLNWTTVDGLPCGLFDCPGTADPTTWQWAAVNITHSNYLYPLLPFVLPEDKYYGLGVWIPSGFSIPSYATGTGTKILELHYADGEPPLALRLFADHVHLDLNGGAWNGTQYAYGQGHGTIPVGLYAIPAGGLVPNAWNFMTWHMHWANDTTGAGEFYYRAKGAGSWNSGSTFSGFPTHVWNTSGGAGPLQTASTGGYYMNNLLNYVTALRSDFPLYLTRFIIADSLAAVQAVFP